MKIVRLNRDVLNRNGASKRPIWLTELTWSSAKGRKTPITKDWETTEAGQAQRLREAFGLFIKARRSLRLGRIYWYTWITVDRDSPNSFDYSGLRTLRADGSVADKPAARAFRAVVRRSTARAIHEPRRRGLPGRGDRRAAAQVQAGRRGGADLGHQRLAGRQRHADAVADGGGRQDLADDPVLRRARVRAGGRRELDLPRVDRRGDRALGGVEAEDHAAPVELDGGRAVRPRAGRAGEDDGAGEVGHERGRGLGRDRLRAAALDDRARRRSRRPRRRAAPPR